MRRVGLESAEHRRLRRQTQFRCHIDQLVRDVFAVDALRVAVADDWSAADGGAVLRFRRTDLHRAGKLMLGHHHDVPRP
jgi:hypothetical protein